jgi:hypothetical protein
MSWSRSENGTAWTTTVGGPLNYAATYYFQEASSAGIQSVFETERQVSGLKTVYTCYNGAVYPCNSTAISLPITRRTIWTQLGTETSESKRGNSSANHLHTGRLRKDRSPIILMIVLLASSVNSL